jgi:hypothetical protein
VHEVPGEEAPRLAREPGALEREPLGELGRREQEQRDADEREREQRRAARPRSSASKPKPVTAPASRRPR